MHILPRRSSRGKYKKGSDSHMAYEKKICTTDRQTPKDRACLCRGRLLHILHLRRKLLPDLCCRACAGYHTGMMVGTNDKSTDVKQFHARLYLGPRLSWPRRSRTGREKSSAAPRQLQKPIPILLCHHWPCTFVVVCHSKSQIPEAE